MSIPAMPQRVREILDRVAEEHGTTTEALTGHSHRKGLAVARYEAYSRIVAQIVINRQPPSLPQIGAWVNRDHTTVLYGLRRHASGFEWNQHAKTEKGVGKPKGEMYSRMKLVAMMNREPLQWDNVRPVSPAVQAAVLQQFALLQEGAA